MNKIWSSRVQSTEILYYSREERFNDQNCMTWFELLNVKDGMKVLEVGCGGGHFTNMVKKYFSSCEVYGIDLDEMHIDFAKRKCSQLGLDVKYQVADITDLPFDDETFDIVFSHTVVEHLPFDNFIKEQRRVLKTGGTISIMRVEGGKRDNPFMYLENEIDQVFDQMIINNSPKVGQYGLQPEQLLTNLNNYGFKNLDFRYNRFMFYCPDIAPNSDLGLQQINRHHEMIRWNALFNLQLSENGKDLAPQLLDLLDRQHKKRVELYLTGEKIFDYITTYVSTALATK